MPTRTLLALIIAGCVAAALIATKASAALIDFRDQTYSCGGCTGGNPDGAPSAELVVDGVTWTFTPHPEDALLYAAQLSIFSILSISP